MCTAQSLPGETCCNPGLSWPTRLSYGVAPVMRNRCTELAANQTSPMQVEGLVTTAQQHVVTGQSRHSWDMLNEISSHRCVVAM